MSEPTPTRMRITCPGCGHSGRVPITAVGQGVRCPQCKTRIPVPAPPGASRPPTVPPVSVLPRPSPPLPPGGAAAANRPDMPLPVTPASPARWLDIATRVIDAIRKAPVKLDVQGFVNVGDNGEIQTDYQIGAKLDYDDTPQGDGRGRRRPLGSTAVGLGVLALVWLLLTRGVPFPIARALLAAVASGTAALGFVAATIALILALIGRRQLLTSLVGGTLSSIVLLVGILVARNNWYLLPSLPHPPKYPQAAINAGPRAVKENQSTLDNLLGKYDGELTTTGVPDPNGGHMVNAMSFHGSTTLDDDGFKAICAVLATIPREELPAGPGQPVLGYLDLGGTTLSDAGLAEIEAFPDLIDLDLSGTGLTDAGLERLVAWLPRLQILTLGKREGGWYPTLHIIRQRMRLSKFDGVVKRPTKVTDRGLAAVARLRELQALYLEDSGVRDLAPLAKMPGLRVLGLTGSTVRDDDLAALAGHPGLAQVTLNETQVGDPGLVHLGGLAALQGQLWNQFTVWSGSGVVHIDLRRTKVTDTGIDLLRDRLPDAVILPDVAESTTRAVRGGPERLAHLVGDWEVTAPVYARRYLLQFGDDGVVTVAERAQPGRTAVGRWRSSISEKGIEFEKPLVLDWFRAQNLWDIHWISPDQFDVLRGSSPRIRLKRSRN